MSARRWRIAIAFASILAAACAPLGPDYTRPAIDLPQNYPDGLVSNAADNAAGAALRADWWTLYGDAKLDQLVASALARNSDIRLAVARIEEADANLREADAAFLPQIDLNSVPTHSRISSTQATPLPGTVPAVRNNVRLTASTSFELDFWGRLRRGVEAVRAQTLGTRYAKDVVALSLAGLTAQAYFSLRSLDAQIGVTRLTLASREEALDYVRRRARGGIASDLDVSQAESARADSAVQQTDLVRQRALLEHQLATLAGRLDISVPAGDLLALPLPPLPPAGLPSALLERRPDIRVAEQALVSANAQIGVAKAAMLPTILLTGADGWESRALSSLLQGTSNIWSLGFALSLPIFDSGRFQARTDAAIARERQSLAAYQKSMEGAFREVADALTSVQQTSAAEADYQARVTAARRTLHLARLRYAAGYSAYLEVLDAQRTANEAELAFVRNRQARLSASVDLMKALGGGWESETSAAKH
ncbi:MAG: efflux transporter outer membrane subunit [Betaproteobacteria bacterium]|nr:efflux transporter outer membrane subunit [Betaproteobacteria bacterium]